MQSINQPITMTRAANLIDCMLSALSRIAGDGDEALALLTDLAPMFLDEAPTLIDQLESALERRDPLRLRRAAQKLHESSSALGASRLATLCQQLEYIGQRGALALAPVKLAELKAEYGQVQATLHRYVL